MVALFTAIIGAFRSAFRPRASLVAENLALRQQLAVLRRKTKRPQLRFLIRDRDRIFGGAFDQRVNNLGVRQLRIAPRSPWQNGYAERLVGTFRRELTDHLIVISERHLLRRVREYTRFYNEDRPHMSLAGDAPAERAIEPPENGTVVALPRVVGLHHRYARRAA